MGSGRRGAQGQREDLRVTHTHAHTSNKQAHTHTLSLNASIPSPLIASLPPVTHLRGTKHTASYTQASPRRLDTICFLCHALLALHVAMLGCFHWLSLPEAGRGVPLGVTKHGDPGAGLHQGGPGHVLAGQPRGGVTHGF